MKKRVHAYVQWIPFSEGGRRSPIPLGMKYGPIIRFEEEINRIEEWSAEIYVIRNDSDNTSLIELSYLVSKAPFHNLSTGKTFELFEGNRLVAKGTIL